MTEDTCKRVFLSYSWTIQDKVIDLAGRLANNGVYVVADFYDLKEGHDKYRFMEQSVNDSSIDKVLILCDRTYKEKADSRTGGVGTETMILTPELYDQAEQDKYIPVIMERDEEGNKFVPSFVKNRIYIDLSNDDAYESEFEILLRCIYDKPLHIRPQLGQMPSWLQNTSVDLSPLRDITRQIKGVDDWNSRKADYLIRRAQDCFIKAAMEYERPSALSREDGVLDVINREIDFRNCFIDFCEALILSDNHKLGTIIGSIFESLYNGVHDVEFEKFYDKARNQIYDFMMWELFIDTMATLFHYECYVDINELLSRQYFLITNPKSDVLTPFPYYKFYSANRFIEERCKPKSENPQRITMSGDMLINRVKPPVLTKSSIANTDLILYQLGRTIKVDSLGFTMNYWFPRTYIYSSPKQRLWQQLRSLKFCYKILPLFGVNDVEQLKGLIKCVRQEPDMRYQNCFESASAITNSITVSEIGTLY